MDAENNTIRLQCGARGKTLVMCASTAAERGKWLIAIEGAVQASQDERDKVFCRPHSI
ncbi:hypothetical protein V7S43_001662 [Phytophthora oleae]|uniref:PH domain-containing protein n=1 Tax=Phytophthora oleae TaxID=2107226 RepID=A0ABD3G5V2_9STRA